MPYEIYETRLVGENHDYKIRDDARTSHYALVMDEDGETQVKVSLGQRGYLWLRVVTMDEEGDAVLKMADFIESVAALKKLEGVAPDALNPYLDVKDAEEAARIVVQAAEALRTHPAHGCDEIATELETQMLQVIDLAKNRDYATIAVPDRVE